MNATGSRKKAVFLTSESPFPPMGGGKIRDFHLIRLLAERYDVEVLTFGSGGSFSRSSAELPEGVRVIEVTRDRAPLWKRSIYPLRPYVVNGFSEEMAWALRHHAEPGKLIWISRLAMAQYIPLCRKLGYEVVLDEHNVESNLLLGDALSSLRHLPSLWIAAQCSYYESSFCKQANAVVATSDIDASKLTKLAPGTEIHVIPNPVDADVYAPLRDKEGSTIFFSGTLSYAPNADGLRWFMAEVLPRLKRSMGETLPRIVVAGSNPSASLVSELSEAGIELHANPDSMLPFLQDAAVVIVPLRSGSGTRLKILEAMASGRAVVSTGKGAEGLVLSPTYDIWIADAADRFTSAIIHLLEDRELRATLGKHAAETVSNRYDWRRVRDLVDSVLKVLPTAGTSRHRIEIT